MIWCHVSQADEYVELISSFETDAEALMFAYDAEDKGWAKVSTERASHGDRSLKVGFLMSEAEINRGAFAAFFHRILAFLSYIPRSLGISIGGDEEGKLALLGRSLPFDWEGIDALVFEAYNPSGAPLELSLEVKSGLYDWDPTAKLYHTKVMIPPKKWEAVRLSTSAMGDSLHPDGVIHVRMTLSAKGVLYIDNVRFVAATTPVPETKFVRLTWTRDPRTTQTITWQSRAQAGEVRFGSSGGKLLTTVEAKSTPVFTWSHGVFHEATLTGVLPMKLSSRFWLALTPKGDATLSFNCSSCSRRTLPVSWSILVMRRILVVWLLTGNAGSRQSSHLLRAYQLCNR
jgi:hypothetical protein